MADYNAENNLVTIIGTVLSPFVYSHTKNGERFYKTKLAVNRCSDQTDTIPLMVSGLLMKAKHDYTGECIRVTGQFRSFNEHAGELNRVILYVFADIWESWQYAGIEGDQNVIYLDGYVCREPVFRKTPGGKEIADLMLAVKRPYGKADYIPGICWGRNARYASGFGVGNHVQLKGRIQSREYTKHTGDCVAEKRVAYEVSVNRIQPVEEN